MKSAHTAVKGPDPSGLDSATTATFGVRAAMAGACARIAPTWPLDRFIAVNPFWEMVDKPLSELSVELTALSGARLLMPRAWYREARRAGQLSDEHLRSAITLLGSSVTVAELVALLDTHEPSVPRRARVMDVADSRRDPAHGMSFRDFVIHSSSQFCASYFDEGQAQFGPDRTGGLFASWRRHAQLDQSPSLLMGLRDYGKLVRELPETTEEMALLALTDLAIPDDEWESYFMGLLLDLNGWAAWCAYRRWTARLSGGQDAAIADLLGMRLAWEWLLYRAGGPRLAPLWRFAMAAWPASDVAANASQSQDWVFQKALELAWQQQISSALPSGLATPAPVSPVVQAVFCIDVRSEVFRRALEAETEAVQTLGFAGFFGLPIEYQPVASASARPQLPGLLAARLRVTDEGVPADLAARRGARLDVSRAWKGFKTNAVSSFSFIESMGVFYAGQLLRESFGKGPEQRPDGAGLTAGENSKRKPRITAFADGRPVAAGDRSDVAAGMLKAMSLTHDFARLVLLTGHASETRNNPHAAGLDCGACCGQTGEVNARAAAALLNHPEVRSGLQSS